MAALSLGWRTPPHSVEKPAPCTGAPRVVTHSLSALERLPGKLSEEEEEEVGVSRRDGVKKERKCMQGKSYLEGKK